MHGVMSCWLSVSVCECEVVGVWEVGSWVEDEGETGETMTGDARRWEGVGVTAVEGDCVTVTVDELAQWQGHGCCWASCSELEGPVALGVTAAGRQAACAGASGMQTEGGIGPSLAHFLSRNSSEGLHHVEMWEHEGEVTGRIYGPRIQYDSFCAFERVPQVVP